MTVVFTATIAAMTALPTMVWIYMRTQTPYNLYKERRRTIYSSEAEIRILARKVEAMRHELTSSIDETRYAICDRLAHIEAFLCPPRRVVKMVFATTIGGMKMEISYMQLKVSNKLPLSIKLVDKFGNPAVVDGAPVWALTNPALGSLVVAEGGLSAEFIPAGAVGSLTVQVSADADLGEGVKTIFGELPIDLLAGDAVNVVIEAGAPVPVE
jgi:hypothetical protein